MKMPTTRLCLLLAVSALGLLWPAGGRAAADDPWVLAFENDTPKSLVLEDLRGDLTYYWYLVYRVKNPNPEPHYARLEVSLVLELAKEQSPFRDVYAPLAERRLEEKVVERPLLNWAELRREALKPGQQAEGVAIFRVGPQARDFDKMIVRVRGLVARRGLGREAPESNVRKFRERHLLIQYDYVPSRWTSGKDLKYDAEAWELVEMDVADRDATADDAMEEVKQKMRELRELLKKDRDLRRPEETPGKSSARPQAAPDLAGRPNPRLLQALRERADRHTSVRAAYTELLGPPDRRQTASGTLYLGAEGRFASERVLGVGADRALKERRAFDGQTLWIHVATQEMGDIVRKWGAEATRREWRAIEGRPEVDFATLVNPARAWRLFGDDLVYLGFEQLKAERAHVFEVRPGDPYRTVLGGPLSGELLGAGLGRRVRFWIGDRSGFQHRVRVYDDHYEVLGSLECFDLELDAHTDPARYAFTPPAGVKVIDMNAVMARNGSGRAVPAP